MTAFRMGDLVTLREWAGRKGRIQVWFCLGQARLPSGTGCLVLLEDGGVSVVPGRWMHIVASMEDAAEAHSDP